MNVFIPYEVGSYVAGFVEVTLSTALWMNLITRAEVFSIYEKDSSCIIQFDDESGLDQIILEKL